MKRSVYGQTILLCSLLLFGCKVRQQESDAKLVGGELVASDQAFPATVRINEKCTAARIGQASFLLAAHCLPNFECLLDIKAGRKTGRKIVY